MIYTPEQVFAKDLSNLHLLVNWASDMQRCGSYSQRRPDLGKCRTCPYCHRRRYENGPRCCNPAYAKTKRAWSEEEGFHQVECEERIHQQPISKPIIKRFLHKRHGQSRHWKVRSLTLIFQNNEEALRNAVNEMQTKIPEPAHIPSFTEHYWAWKQKRIVRAERKRAQAGRKHAKQS